MLTKYKFQKVQGFGILSQLKKWETCEKDDLDTCGMYVEQVWQASHELLKTATIYHCHQTKV